VTDISVTSAYPFTPPPFHPDDILARAWDEGLAPDPELTVSEWADRYRILSSRGAAEAGRYRTSRAPYIKEIMDSLSALSPVRRVVFKKGAQIGASEAGVCWIGYIMDQVPGPVMMVQPTVDTAKRFSTQRLQPLIDDSPQLRGKVSRNRSRDTTNTMLMKEFVGGVLIITGANSAVGLRSMPVRYLMLDEVDAYPGDIEDEGDPVALAEARTRTFGVRSKILLASTPKLKGTSRITREFDATDKRFYFVPCPHCGLKQVLNFNRMKWEAGQPRTVTYQCEGCDGAMREHHKTAMLAGGEWRATAETNDRSVRGYHLSALYSPIGWMSWAEVVAFYEGSINDVEKRKSFINTVLGEEYEEEAEIVPDWQRLYERREDWPFRGVPMRGLFLTAGADVQADRIELDVWAWGRGLESWLVEHMVVYGDPGEAGTWEHLTNLLSTTWRHASGKRLVLQRLAIDTGAFTQQVYAWVRKQSRLTVLAVKGVPQYDRSVPVSGPVYVEVAQNGRRIKRGVSLWTVSVSFFKSETYKLLQLDRPTDADLATYGYPAGYVHLPLTLNDEWIKQLVAEQRVIVRGRRGWAVKTEWRQLRPRNEALDMRVYARAAVWMAGADRWTDVHWRDLETQLGLEPPPPPMPAEPPVNPAATTSTPQAGVLAQPVRRPVLRRRFMNLGRL
jgi:phage terminase large subunit GpA-like protein